MTIMSTVAALALAASAQAADQEALAVEPVQPNADVRIERTEITDMAKNVFAKADMDQDAALNQEEFVALANAEVEANDTLESAEMTAEMPAESDVLSGEDMAATPDVEMDADASAYLIAKFQEISGDDGEISETEFAEAVEADFEQADQDANDVLEGDEIETFANLRQGKPSA